MEVGTNVSYKVANNKLTIVIDLDKRFGRSQGGTGKNEIVASTGGNILIDGTPVKLGLNAYTKPGT